MSRKLISFDWVKGFKKRKRGAFSIPEVEAGCRQDPSYMDVK